MKTLDKAKIVLTCRFLNNLIALVAKNYFFWWGVSQSLYCTMFVNLEFNTAILVIALMVHKWSSDNFVIYFVIDFQLAFFKSVLLMCRRLICLSRLQGKKEVRMEGLFSNNNNNNNL